MIEEKVPEISNGIFKTFSTQNKLKDLSKMAGLMKTYVVLYTCFLLISILHV